jgi:hypothetical protein
MIIIIDIKFLTLFRLQGLKLLDLCMTFMVASAQTFCNEYSRRARPTVASSPFWYSLGLLRDVI